MNQPPAVVTGVTHTWPVWLDLFEAFLEGSFFACPVKDQNLYRVGDVIVLSEKGDEGLTGRTARAVIVSTRWTLRSVYWVQFEPIPERPAVKCAHPGCPSVSGSPHSPECEAAHVQAYIGS